MPTPDVLKIDPVQLVDRILPVLLPKLPKVVQQTGGTVEGSGGTGAGSFAELTGTISDAQAPQFLKTDGSRGLSGHLAVGAGFTIDGVDISSHATDPDAHHARVTVSGPLTLAGQLVGLNYGQGLQNILGVQLAVRLDGLSGLAFGTLDGLMLGTPGTVGFSSVNATQANSHTHAVDYTTAGAANKLLALDNGSRGLASMFQATTTLRAPIIDTASGPLTIMPPGEIFLNPGGTNMVRLAAGKVLRSALFASGFTGGGWQIDDGVMMPGYTSAEFDNMTIRGLLRVYELVISKIRTGNGSYLFTDGGKVTGVTGTGPYTLTFDEDHNFALNDLIMAQKFLSGAYISRCTVTGVTDKRICTVTLNTGNAPAVGYEYARIGNTTDANRQGSVYITSNDSGAPYLDVINGVNSHAAWGTAAKVKLRLGKLTGITATANEYGLFVGTGFTPTSQYLRLSDSASGNGINNLPLNMTFNGAKSIEINPGTGVNIYAGDGGTVINPSTSIGFYNKSTLGSIVGRLGAIYNTNTFEIAANQLSIRAGSLWIAANISSTSSWDSYARWWSFKAGDGAFPTENANTLMIAPGGVTINNFAVWHAGNLPSPVSNNGSFSTLSGLRLDIQTIRHASSVSFVNLANTANIDVYMADLRLQGGDILSPVAIRMRNSDNTAYQNVDANALINRAGYNYSDNLFRFQNTAGSAYQGVVMGSLTMNTGGAAAGGMSVPANGSGYGYFDFNYNGARAGYLLWADGRVQLQADPGRYTILGGDRIGINTLSPGYTFDVAGEGHITGTFRTDVAFSLLPQASPPGTSFTFGIVYVNSAGQLRFIRRGGGDYYIAG